ncbi:aminotransferase class IV [Rhodopseudomonas palustris]|nr:aminotransferase class IV [Rhodopseudomonas palustris]
MAEWLWFNGKVVEARQVHISPADRGLLLADGVFETMRAQAGRILWLSDHLARLRAGAALLGIPVPFPDDSIAEGLLELTDRAAAPLAALRLTLTRGPGRRRGLWPPDDPVQPTLLGSIAPIAAVPMPAAARLVICRSTRRNEFSPLTRVKHLSYGDALLARREAGDRNATDAVLLNTRGHVACSTVGNIFVRDRNGWATPPLDDGALPGLARARALVALGAEQRSIEASALRSVDAAVLTNSLGITPVSHLDDRPLGVVESPAALAKLYD